MARRLRNEIGRLMGRLQPMGRASYALIVIIYVQASRGIVFPHGTSGGQHSSKTLAGFFREIGKLTELAEDAEP